MTCGQMPSMDQPKRSRMGQIAVNYSLAAVMQGAAIAIITYVCDSLPWPAVRTLLLVGLITVQLSGTMRQVDDLPASAAEDDRPGIGAVFLSSLLYILALILLALVIDHMWSVNAVISLYTCLKLYSWSLLKLLDFYLFCDEPLEEDMMERFHNRLCKVHFVVLLCLLRGPSGDTVSLEICLLLAAGVELIVNQDYVLNTWYNPLYYIWWTWRYAGSHLRLSVAYPLHVMKWKWRSSSEDMHKKRLSFQDHPEFDYSYCPVRPDQIRILAIERQSFIGGLLELTMLPISREQSIGIEYEALSYTWGDSSLEKQPILLNGKKFYIHQNLYRLLWARSSMFRHRFLWADALSIDQTNPAEKSSQVKRMKEVYVNARRVVAWLGDAYDAGIAVQMMDRIAGAYSTWADEPTQFYRSFDWQGHEWRAFAKIASDDYFSRAWICQEASLGTDLQFYIGGYYVRPGRIFEATGSLLRGEFRSHLSSDGGLDIAKFVRAAQNWHVVYCVRQAEFDEEPGKRYSPRAPISLGLLLSLCSRHKATEPVDKIYSLLGISESTLSNTIVPTYVSRTMAQDHAAHQKTVFIDTAVKLASSQDDAMYLLPHAGIGYLRRSCDLPSWVPVWTGESQRATDIFSIHTRPGQMWYGRDYAPSLSDYQVRASGPSGIKPSFTVLPDLMLLVKAVQIDVIRDLTGVYDNVQEDTNYHLLWLSKVEQCLQNIKGPQARHEDELWRTLVLDGTYETRPYPDSHKLAYYLWRAKGPRPQVSVDSTKIATLKSVSLLGHLLSEGNADKKLEDMVLEYGSRFADSCGGRRFCTTGTKRIGLTPPKAEVGDVVCIILGLQVPYLLRWCGSKNAYELVGECYVHGVMFGEALAGAVMGDLEIA